MQNSTYQQAFSLGGNNNSFGLFNLGSGFFTNSFLQEQLQVPSTPLSSDTSFSASTINTTSTTNSIGATATSTATTTPSNSSNNATSSQTTTTFQTQSQPQIPSQSQTQIQTQIPSPQSQSQIQSSSPPMKEASLQVQIPLQSQLQQAHEANKSSPAAVPTPLSVPIPLRPTAGFDFSQSKDIQLTPSMISIPAIPTNANVIVENLMKNTKFDEPQEIIERPHGQEGKMFVDVTPYLVLSQSDAAKMIGIPSSTLSKRWKEATLNRKWPFRTVQKLDREILTLLRNLESYKFQGKDNYVSAAAETALVRLLRLRKEELRQVYIRIT